MTFSSPTHVRALISCRKNTHAYALLCWCLLYPGTCQWILRSRYPYITWAFCNRQHTAGPSAHFVVWFWWPMFMVSRLSDLFQSWFVVIMGLNFILPTLQFKPIKVTNSILCMYLEWFSNKTTRDVLKSWLFWAMGYYDHNAWFVKPTKSGHIYIYILIYIHRETCLI